ncbi:MAG: cyclic nucleotide-binding domain-containing protein [Magnetospirillum sp.]
MVKPDNLAGVLQEHPFFQGIAPSLRDLLVGCAANERFEAGSMLFRQGDSADKFYLIRSGTVAIEIDQPARPPIVVETITEGEVAGWSWLVPPYRLTFDARALTLVRALSFDAQCLRRKMEAEPALGYDVLRRFLPIMAHRLSASRLQMLDLYAPPKPAKVKKEKAEKAAKKSKGTNRSPDARLKKAKKKDAKS